MSKAVIGELFQRPPSCLVDKLKQYYRVDVPPPQPDSQVQMRTGRAACATAYTHHIPRPHAVTLLHSPFRQMAIADREITVSHGDIFPGHPVLSRLHHDAVHHGVGLAAVSPQVQTVVPLAFFRERVCTHTERRSDINLLQRIGHAQVAVYPLFPHGSGISRCLFHRRLFRYFRCFPCRPLFDTLNPVTCRVGRYRMELCRRCHAAAQSRCNQ